MNILVLDLDGQHGTNLRVVLEHAGHTVAIATGVAAAAACGKWDLALLAGAAAPSACARLRAHDPALPIVRLTARGLVEDSADDPDDGTHDGTHHDPGDGLEVPFTAAQLVTRVNTVGRRARMVPPLPELIDADGCLFDLSRCVAVRDARPIALSPREAELVRWLHRHRHRAVERPEILEHVFGVAPGIESRSVDMAIATLRKKIEREPDRPAIIVSVKGTGYAWGQA
jgi:DNA-binding response OmpR family regulator